MMDWLVTNMDKIAIILSLTSFVMSGYALYLNRQRTAITVRNDKEQQIEKKKAKIRIERVKEQGLKRLNDILLVKNEGKATATNIEIKWRNRNGEVNPVFDKVPSTIVGGDTAKCSMGIHNGTAPPWEVIITWDDENQTNNVYEIHMN